MYPFGGGVNSTFVGGVNSTPLSGSGKPERYDAFPVLAKVQGQAVSHVRRMVSFIGKALYK